MVKTHSRSYGYRTPWREHTWKLGETRFGNLVWRYGHQYRFQDHRSKDASDFHKLKNSPLWQDNQFVGLNIQACLKEILIFRSKYKRNTLFNNPNILLVLFGLCCSVGLYAQPDTVTFAPGPLGQDVLEDVVRAEGGDGEFDFNTLLEGLEIFRKNPINLNKATEEEFRSLNLLTDPQILAILDYRIAAGPFISPLELQAIPGIDADLARFLSDYVTTSEATYQQSLGKMITTGSNRLFIRWTRFLQEQRGYTRPPEEGGYTGDPNQLYVRFIHTHSNRLSYGFTADKDRGEEFFTGSNPQGFDFYSGHFFLRDYSPVLKSVALGDFAVNFGQGLILFAGFGYGKSALSTTIKRSGRTLRPYTSVNEAQFMRGGGITLGFGELEVTALASYRRRDANLVGSDTLDQNEFFVTSIGESGLHRTLNEIADEGAIGQFTLGGSAKYRFRRGHIAVNALFDRLDRELRITPRPDNQFFFEGRQLFNASLDYAWRWRNLHFFGETAISDNGAIATLNGLLMALDRKVDLAMLVRHYPRDYQALNANPFGESTGARNETGAYLGLEIRPFSEWTFNAYFDVWRFPWLRFNIDRPSIGYEYRLRLTWIRKRTWRFYIEMREENKVENRTGNTDPLNTPLPRTLLQARLHLAYNITKALELRTRVDWGFFRNEGEPELYGVAVYQDVIFRPLSFPISFSARYALFDTDGFDIRFYSYENNLLYTFSIPAYFDRGSRFYFNVRYRPIKMFTIEARYARWSYTNRETVGSGGELVNRPFRDEVGVQVRLNF